MPSSADVRLRQRLSCGSTRLVAFLTVAMGVVAGLRWPVGALIMVVAVALTACQVKTPDRSSNVDELTDMIRELPGVLAASSRTVNSTARDLVYFVIRVDTAPGITSAQLSDITSRYLQALATGAFAGYRAELDAGQGWSTFAVDSGNLPITNGPEVVRQAGDWVTLRHEFPTATIRLRATITHPGGQAPIQEWGRSNVAGIRLADPANHSDVSAVFTTLSTKFPQLARLTWTVSAGKQHPADIKTSLRFPSAAELDVWNALNADQAIAHVDKMTINGRVKAPVWLAEEVRSHDPGVAVQLAQRHLPIVTRLPAPLLYTASDQIQGYINGDGRATGPIAITTGGCTARDNALYRPLPAEQALIAQYEICHH